MRHIDWPVVCVSLVAGVLLGITVGAVSHWSIGIAVLAVWLIGMGITEGLATAITPLTSKSEPNTELCR